MTGKPGNNEKREFDNYPDYIEQKFEFNITSGYKPVRIDIFLTNSIEKATRTKVRKSLDSGNVLVNGNTTKASYKIRPGDKIVCSIMKAPPLELIPQDIPLNIVYEDEELIVVNKPAGLVVHPGVGNRYGTLVNALLYHFGVRENISLEDYEEDDDSEETGSLYGSSEIRPGIVHRIDKNTSGLMVVAKNTYAHSQLAKQFFDRTTSREYNAFVWGKLKEDEGNITGNIARSTRDRKKFAVHPRDGKYASTDYKVIRRYRFATLVKYKLHTGRTHQIRVHTAYINHPVIGDEMYGGDKILQGGNLPQFKSLAVRTLKIAQRQMLHAKKLGFDHPKTGERLEFDSDLPEDFKELIEIYEQAEEAI